MNQKPLTDRTGATAVEMALTLPVLMLLLFGAYEISRANMIMHGCEAAAYEGARVGIVPGATVAEVTDAVNGVLATIGISNANVTTTPANLATDSETVLVAIEVSFADNFLLAPVFVGSAPIVRACEMTRETF